MHTLFFVVPSNLEGHHRKVEGHIKNLCPSTFELLLRRHWLWILSPLKRTATPSRWKSRGAYRDLPIFRMQHLLTDIVIIAMFEPAAPASSGRVAAYCVTATCNIKVEHHRQTVCLTYTPARSNISDNSLTNAINSSGPMPLPWTTPLIDSTISDSELPILV